MRERSVLHVLPHPGGGGETYVDTLESMEGYRFTRTYLAPGPQPREALGPLLHSVPSTIRAAWQHDLVHVHGEAASLLCLPAVVRRPSIVTLHGLNLFRRLAEARHSGGELGLRLILRSANRTICVSEAEYEIVKAAVGALGSARVVVIQNGIALPTLPNESERTTLRAELGLRDTDVVGIWVGALTARKDPLTAARAAGLARLPLLVVGNGPLLGDVERLGSGHVRTLGLRRDVPRLLAAADFFVHSSLREGLSYSLLEAMAAGLPVVVSDARENLEAAGDAAVVVGHGDVRAFAAAYRELAADAAGRRELGSRARTRVGERFGADRMIASTREAYEQARRKRAVE